MPKLTPSQATILHVVMSLVVGLIVSTGQASYQYFTLHSFNIGATFAYFFMSLIAALLTLPVTLVHTIANNPALPQVEHDLVSEVEQFFEQRATALETNIGSWLVDMEQRLANKAQVQPPATPDWLNSKPQSIQSSVLTASGGVVRAPGFPQASPLVSTPQPVQQNVPTVTTLPSINAVKPAQ